MQIVLDVWEGSLDINEDVLYLNGVRGLIIRLNSMDGGHHMDTNFNIQWEQSRNFLRACYFVYNPWVDGAANVKWLIDHAPAGLTRIFLDIEVARPGYSPEAYADQVEYFVAEVKRIWPLAVIYTGGWFLNTISHWPTGSYWWARYPFAFYPPAKEEWTWEQLQTKMNNFGWNPDPLKQCKGTVDLWQLSGDRLILPGCANRAMDVNGWKGDLLSLETWWGTKLPAPSPTLEQKVAKLVEQAIAHDWDMSF
jgi:hypothetical protein